jgi:CRP-like cAMP-binding protein
MDVFNQISPFDYLTAEEKSMLRANSQMIHFQNQEVICDPDLEDYDWLYLLIRGQVSVSIGGEIIGYIYAPSYFGELSVLFDQPRHAKITAVHSVSCLRIKGEDIRSLLKENLSFYYAFSSSLRYKQQIFSAFQLFLNVIHDKKRQKTFALHELLPLYKNLHPVLHQGLTKKTIDFPALQYALSKLPREITSSSLVVLAEYLPEPYEHLHETLISKSSQVHRKYSCPILPGKILVLLRDETTDYIDTVTNLCLYLIEANKIREKILFKHIVASLSHFYSHPSCSNKEKRQLIKSLPFSDHEKELLSKTFGPDWLKRLHEIVAQSGKMTVEVITPDIRYYALASEIWIRQIKEALDRFWGVNILNEDIEFHIISSNTHSVLNCLSSWIQNKRDEILAWAKSQELDVIPISEPNDQLYAAAKKWLEAYPEELALRSQANAQNGIYELADSSYTGIKVTLIDVTKLGDIDPHLQSSLNTTKKKIIINIDYAFGKQAKVIIRNLILLFNRKIASISVFGKAGAIVGNRGDILLPHTMTLQDNDEFYPIFNQDLTETDLADIGWQKPVHQGGMLTVSGTLMQSREMLLFYKLFAGIIGFEMEGSYYLQEIRWARIQKLLQDNIALRFAYYISDVPLSAHTNLSVRLTISEGVPPVYAITRAILKKILP